MKLEIPQETVVFHRIKNDGKKSNWHILSFTSNNGFTSKTNPEHPDWWDSKSYIGLCGKREDGRIYAWNGTIEFSTIGEINKICNSCFPYYKKMEKNKNEHR